MGRYTGPKIRIHRREGQDIGLKSYNPAKEWRDYAPGMHGQNRRSKQSDFGIQLREKQKVKAAYGVMERQFRTYFKRAARKKGVTGQLLLQFLERRLDNVIYRSGFAVTRAQARQMVSHGNVLVNDRKIDRPSFQVEAGDAVQLKLRKPERTKAIQELHEKVKDNMKTEWLDVDSKGLKAVVKRLPERADIQMPIQEQLIVELYSK